VSGLATDWPALAALVDLLGIDALAHPERLIVLAPLALLPLALALRPRPALVWPAVQEAARAGARRREPAAWIGAALRSVALLCLAVALAGPVAVRALPPPPGLGLDLLLVLDASGSMAAIEPGATPGGGGTRLEIAREAVARFTDRRVHAGDRVGLVAFGATAFTACPLTADRRLLAAALARIAVGVAGDATALGDALALAVERSTRVPAERAGARAIVLLTDGRSNAGEVPVGVATALAAGEAVRVHTVAIGGDEREVAVETPGGLRFERHAPDPETLRRIADRTGGRYFRVRSGADLLAVYAAIDALERSPRPLPTRRAERGRPEPLLAAAAGLVVLELCLLRFVRRPLP